MTLIAGGTNARYLVLYDLNGSRMTGEAGSVVLKAANEDGDVSGILSVAEVDGVNHPGLYRITINLSSYTGAKSWQIEATHSPTGLRFALAEPSDRSSADSALARKALVNRLEVDPDTDSMILYDDDNTALLTFTVKDKDGGTVSTDKQIPARRSKGS